MKWKVIKEMNTRAKPIPKGLVLKQVMSFDIESTVTSTMRILYRMHPNKNLVVCHFNNEQHIFEVGKDVIPYGRGVR